MMDILYTGEHLTVLAADSSATDMPHELAGTLFGVAGGLVNDFADQLRLRRDRVEWVRNCRATVDQMFEQLEAKADKEYEGDYDDRSTLLRRSCTNGYSDEEWDSLELIGGGE